MISASPHQYILEGIQLEVPRDTLDAAVRQAEAVERHGLAAILTLGHLAAVTGVYRSYLRAIVERSQDPYRSFAVEKRGQSTKRYISIPELRLMAVQRWLLRNVLNLAASHPRSFAYERKMSVRKCAQQHCGANWLVKMDLHDFFHSIDEKQVYSALLGLHYQPLVAFELSRITTRLIGTSTKKSRARPEKYSIESYHSERLGFLPQGAPTSGKLANLVARPLDERLSLIASEHGAVYTRYADDLVFSSIDPFNRSSAVRLLRDASGAVRSCKFAVHEKKTRIVPPGARKLVLGLLVDSDSPRLPAYVRKGLENHLRGVEKFGVVEHSRHRNFSSTWGFVAHVWGLLAFVSDIEPSWASRIRARWQSVLDRDGWQNYDLLHFRPDLYIPDSTAHWHD